MIDLEPVRELLLTSKQTPEVRWGWQHLDKDFTLETPFFMCVFLQELLQRLSFILIKKSLEVK